MPMPFNPSLGQGVSSVNPAPAAQNPTPPPPVDAASASGPGGPGGAATAMGVQQAAPQDLPPEDPMAAGQQPQQGQEQQAPPDLQGGMPGMSWAPGANGSPIYPDFEGPVNAGVPKLAQSGNGASGDLPVLGNGLTGYTPAKPFHGGLLSRKAAFDAMGTLALQRAARRSRHNGEEGEEETTDGGNTPQPQAANFAESLGPPRVDKIAFQGMGVQSAGSMPNMQSTIRSGGSPSAPPAAPPPPSGTGGMGGGQNVNRTGGGGMLSQMRSLSRPNPQQPPQPMGRSTPPAAPAPPAPPRPPMMGGGQGRMAPPPAAPKPPTAGRAPMAAPRPHTPWGGMMNFFGSMFGQKRGQDLLGLSIPANVKSALEGIGNQLTRSAVGESGLVAKEKPWALQGEAAWPGPEMYHGGKRKPPQLSKQANLVQKLKTLFVPRSAMTAARSTIRTPGGGFISRRPGASRLRPDGNWIPNVEPGMDQVVRPGEHIGGLLPRWRSWRRHELKRVGEQAALNRRRLGGAIGVGALGAGTAVAQANSGGGATPSTPAPSAPPKAEAPKAAPPKAAPPKAAPKAEAPKVEAPKTEAPKTETPATSDSSSLPSWVMPLAAGVGAGGLGLLGGYLMGNKDDEEKRGSINPINLDGTFEITSQSGIRFVPGKNLQLKTASSEDKYADRVRKLEERHGQSIDEILKRAVADRYPDLGNTDPFVGLLYYPSEKLRFLEGMGIKAASGPDRLPGGLADKNTDDDSFAENQMEMGEDVEMEHTDDDEVAEEIARDHLTEDPEYYTKLKKMEGDKHASIVTDVGRCDDDHDAAHEMARVGQEAKMTSRELEDAVAEELKEGGLLLPGLTMVKMARNPAAAGKVWRWLRGVKPKPSIRPPVRPSVPKFAPQVRPPAGFKPPSFKPPAVKPPARPPAVPKTTPRPTVRPTTPRPGGGAKPPTTVRPSTPPPRPPGGGGGKPPTPAPRGGGGGGKPPARPTTSAPAPQGPRGPGGGAGRPATPPAQPVPPISGPGSPVRGSNWAETVNMMGRHGGKAPSGMEALRSFGQAARDFGAAGYARAARPFQAAGQWMGRTPWAREFIRNPAAGGFAGMGTGFIADTGAQVLGYDNPGLTWKLGLLGMGARTPWGRGLAKIPGLQQYAPQLTNAQRVGAAMFTRQSPQAIQAMNAGRAGSTVLGRTRNLASRMHGLENKLFLPAMMFGQGGNAADQATQEAATATQEIFDNAMNIEDPNQVNEYIQSAKAQAQESGNPKLVAFIESFEAAGGKLMDNVDQRIAAAYAAQIEQLGLPPIEASSPDGVLRNKDIMTYMQQYGSQMEAMLASGEGGPEKMQAMSQLLPSFKGALDRLGTQHPVIQQLPGFGALQEAVASGDPVKINEALKALGQQTDTTSGGQAPGILSMLLGAAGLGDSGLGKWLGQFNGTQQGFMAAALGMFVVGAIGSMAGSSGLGIGGLLGGAALAGLGAFGHKLPGAMGEFFGGGGTQTVQRPDGVPDAIWGALSPDDQAELPSIIQEQLGDVQPGTPEYDAAMAQINEQLSQYLTTKPQVTEQNPAANEGERATGEKAGSAVDQIPWMSPRLRRKLVAA